MLTKVVGIGQSGDFWCHLLFDTFLIGKGGVPGRDCDETAGVPPNNNSALGAPPRTKDTLETWLSITGESWFDFTLGDNLRYYSVNQS